MPHFTGNTLPNVVPQATPNPYVQYSTLPAQGGHGPSPYYHVSPTNAAFKNHETATDMPPPYSEVSYPLQTLPQQFRQQYLTPQPVTSIEDIYEAVGGPVVNDSTVQVVNFDENPPSYSDLYGDTT